MAKTIHKTLPLILLGGACAASVATTTAHASLPQKAKTQTFKGPSVDTRWSPVQVAIVVKGKRIVNVKVSIAPHTSRSVFIDENALPMLKQEVLGAQSETIDTVSGATDTSDAYIQSLQGAVDKARQHKALK